jgi:pyrroline-5-carboxylate reductase
MGRAIFAGLIGPTVTVSGGIRVTNRTAAHAAELTGIAGVTAFSTESDPGANRAAVDGAELVIIAVKPAMVRGVLEEIRDSLLPGAVVISVAAGVSLATIEAAIPTIVSAVRAMPNTPAAIGRGVTGLSAGTRADRSDVATVRSLFETVGTVVEVPESRLDALSTISGSGPAYVFYLIEQLTHAAIAKGFTPEQAAQLVNGTFAGASELLVSSGESPAELRRRVTSPNGTTERAVAVLESAHLADLFDRATDAALARARELAAG